MPTKLDARSWTIGDDHYPECKAETDPFSRFCNCDEIAAEALVVAAEYAFEMEAGR